MEKILKLSALLVANQLDIKAIKAFLDIKPVADSSTELFFSFEESRYQYYFNFGVIVFSGHSEDEIKIAVQAVQSHLRSPSAQWLRDDHELCLEPGTEMEFEFDKLIVDRFDTNVIRIAMFNLAQSVALDHYNQVTETLLTQLNGFTKYLEARGKLSIGRTDMLKFIGRALNTQTEIADNIYIFDAPESVWDDEFQDRLHKGLIKHFDLKVRFTEIEYKLRIISDNLNMFREISHQRESNRLEWIIIILILLEVFDLIITKILNL